MTSRSMRTKLTFPRDEAPHFTPVEWWYYSGHLWAGQERPFAFHCAFFLNQMFMRPPLLSAHCSVGDQAKREFTWAERIGSLPLEAIGRPPLRLNLGDWHAEGVAGKYSLCVGTDDYQLSLSLYDQHSAPTVHGLYNYVSYGKGGKSWYYSRPRLHASGSLVCRGQRHQVTGTVWLDHQWGEFDLTVIRGWDWLGLHLGDGRSLMLYRILLCDHLPQQHGFLGTLVAADGTPSPVSAPETTIAPLRFWNSPRTGQRYPIEWRIALPAQDVDLRATAAITGCELSPTRSPGLHYWEGGMVLNSSTGTMGRGYGEFFRRDFSVWKVPRTTG